MIYAFVTTNLDYCNLILYGLPKFLSNRLQLVQNKVARIVTFTKKYEHITPSLIYLDWLPVENRIIYKILLLVDKAINGLWTSYKSNLLSFCNSSYSLRSCSNKLLQVPSLSLSLMVIEYFLFQDLNHGKVYQHLYMCKKCQFLEFLQKILKDIFISPSLFLICK